MHATTALQVNSSTLLFVCAYNPVVATIYTTAWRYVIVISQDEYDILVITEGKAEDKC